MTMYALALAAGAMLFALAALLTVFLILRAKNNRLRSDLSAQIGEIRVELSGQIQALETRMESDADGHDVTTEEDDIPTRPVSHAAPHRRADAALLAKVKALAAQPAI